MKVKSVCLGVARLEPFVGQDGVAFDGGWRLCLASDLFAPAGAKGQFAEVRFVGVSNVMGSPVPGADCDIDATINKKGVKIEYVTFMSPAAK